MKSIKGLNKVVEKKILKRLGEFALFNKEKAAEIDVVSKGTFIFSEKEPDKKSAQRFFVYLLDCLERWS